eukprot:scaffold2693_cov139-Isochrysis_galbana.AAC.8
MRVIAPRGMYLCAAPSLGKAHLKIRRSVCASACVSGAFGAEVSCPNSSCMQERPSCRESGRRRRRAAAGVRQLLQQTAPVAWICIAAGCGSDLSMRVHYDDEGSGGCDGSSHYPTAAATRLLLLLCPCAWSGGVEWPGAVATRLVSLPCSLLGLFPLSLDQGALCLRQVELQYTPIKQCCGTNNKRDGWVGERDERRGPTVRVCALENKNQGAEAALTCERRLAELQAHVDG